MTSRRIPLAAFLMLAGVGAIIAGGWLFGGVLIGAGLAFLTTRRR